MLFVMQHHQTKLYVGQATKEEEAQSYRVSGAAKAIGASGHYRWQRNVADAMRFTEEVKADTVWLFLGEPWVDFVDVEA